VRSDLVTAFLMIACSSAVTFAAEDRLLEEIIVTAQRVEENAQKVPIAINAFDETGIEDRQIIGIADLALFVPNLSYNTNNVGDAHVSIRGIGSLVSRSDGESGVSLHINEVPLPPGQPPLEIYDLARIEVLRGPQGTLYGRNATGGVINLITNKPSFDGTKGYLDVEAGGHDLLRVRGAFNTTWGDTLAVRIAGLSLDRDGYTDNLAGGQVPGVPSEIDSRNLYGVRASATWRVTNGTEVWGMYERLDEDDDRMLTHNRRCKTALSPATRTGCEPGEFALGAHNPNQARVGTAVANGLRGVIPLGARDAESGLVFRYPRPDITNLRDVHIDLVPTYEFEQNLWQLGASHEFDWAELSFVGGYQEWRLHTLRDNDFSVGHELAAVPENPTGRWPVSALPEGKNPLDGPECNVNEAQGGVLGGCVLDPNLTRQFWYADARDQRDFYTAEIRLRSDLEGRVNFLVGANYQFSDAYGVGIGGVNDFWEMWTLFGNSYVANPAVDPFGLTLVPPFRVLILPAGESKAEFESYSAFSEMYVNLTDSLKLTVAARYNHDEKRIEERGAAGALDANASFGGVFGDTLWVRFPAFLYALGASPDSSLLDFYGLTEEVDAARATGGPFAALQAAAGLPLLTAWNETRMLAGDPTNFDWDAISGRLVLDWQISENTLVYGSYARGYKPGGFNDVGASDTEYDREDVNSFEIGLKTLLADDSLSLNVAAFFNDYKDLQLTNLALEQFTRQIENTNVDAEMYGAEVEARWRPFFAPHAELEVGYAWLSAEVKDEAPRIDPLWLTNGAPNYVELYSFATGTGSPSGRYIARVDDVLPLVDAAIAVGAAIGPDDAPATVYPNGIPAWFDGLFLLANGVELQPGISIAVANNQIPDTPEHTLHIGASYTWNVLAGALTARWDYYWQSTTYLTLLNRSIDSIGSWDQHTASLIFESGDGRWSVRTWVRNIENDVHILGGYRQQSAVDFSVTEPRAWGASVRYNFGIL
jgi:iron complex outermembrane receptor protein